MRRVVRLRKRNRRAVDLGPGGRARRAVLVRRPVLECVAWANRRARVVRGYTRQRPGGQGGRACTVSGSKHVSQSPSHAAGLPGTHADERPKHVPQSPVCGAVQASARGMTGGAASAQWARDGTERGRVARCEQKLSAYAITMPYELEKRMLQ